MQGSPTHQVPHVHPAAIAQLLHDLGLHTLPVDTLELHAWSLAMVPQASAGHRVEGVRTHLLQAALQQAWPSPAMQPGPVGVPASAGGVDSSVWERREV